MQQQQEQALEPRQNLLNRISSTLGGQPGESPVQVGQKGIQQYVSRLVGTRSVQGEGSPEDEAWAAGVIARGGSSKAVEEAKKYLGVPYKWGGTDPETGFDCSGLIQYVFKEAYGINLPRVSYEQAKAGQSVGKDIGNARPGDILAYPRGNMPVGHVAIYIGNGQMLQAPRKGKNVEIVPVRKDIVDIRRVT